MKTKRSLKKYSFIIEYCNKRNIPTGMDWAYQEAERAYYAKLEKENQLLKSKNKKYEFS